jgi:hypothetical protein
MKRLPKLVMGAVAIAALLSVSPAAFAQLLDGSTLQIGNPPTAGDPNQISNNLVVINLNNNGGVNTGGKPNLKQPVLLVLGIPNVGNNFFNGVNPVVSVTSSAGGSPTSTLGGPSVYSGVWDASTGFATNGPMDGSPTHNEVYSILGVDPPTNNSNHFSNWAAADLAINGITVSEFGIYVIEINGILTDKGSLSVTFPTSGAGELPQGTFVVAYGQDDKHVYDTPFTESGLTTNGPPPPPPPPPPFGGPVPEPASLVLLSLGGVIGLGALGFKRRQKA